MFERITGGEFSQYNPQALSRPSQEDKEAPWIVTLENFLTEEECDFLIARGHHIGYEESYESTDEVDEDGEYVFISGTGRTSRNAWCEEECEELPITIGIMDRMSRLTGFSEANAEYLQLLKYEVGEHYEEHHDLYGTSDLMQGDRVLTFFLYLNEVEGGGETRFTWPCGTKGPHIDVKPKRGGALIWPSVLDADLATRDDRTWHQALPVTMGRKYGANVWFRLRNQKEALKLGC